MTTIALAKVNSIVGTFSLNQSNRLVQLESCVGMRVAKILCVQWNILHLVLHHVSDIPQRFQQFHRVQFQYDLHLTRPGQRLI